MINASSMPGVEPAGMAAVIHLAAGVTVVLVPATTYCSCRERYLSDCCWKLHLCSHTPFVPSLLCAMFSFGRSSMKLQQFCNAWACRRIWRLQESGDESKREGDDDNRRDDDHVI